MRFKLALFPLSLLMILACGGSGGTTMTEGGSASSTSGGGQESSTGAGEASTSSPTTGGSDSNSGTSSGTPGSSTSSASTADSSTTSPVDMTTSAGSTSGSTSGEESTGEASTGGESSGGESTSGGGEIKDCNAWQKAFDAEVLEIRGCMTDDECGVEMKGTSCGCTRNWVSRLDADLAEFDALVETANELGCDLPFISTCDCPPTDGFECAGGICNWNYL